MYLYVELRKQFNILLITFSKSLLSLFIFHLDGLQLPTNHLQQVVNGTLTILKVRKPYDAGRYTCSAENSDGQGSENSLYINVLGKA